MTEREKERDQHTKIILRKDICMEKLHLLIHYVELDKMKNERKNVERSLCYHNDIRGNLICFYKEIGIERAAISP